MWRRPARCVVIQSLEDIGFVAAMCMTAIRVDKSQVSAITCRWRTAPSGQPSAALRLMLSRSACSRRVRVRVQLRGTTAGLRNPVGYAHPGRRG